MKILDNLWWFMRLHYNSSQLMTIHDDSWWLMTIHDDSWQFRTIEEGSWQFMTIDENSWQLMTIHDKPAARPLTNALTQAAPRDPKQIKTAPSELDDRSSSSHQAGQWTMDNGNEPAPVGSTSSNGPPSVELNTNISNFPERTMGFQRPKSICKESSRNICAISTVSR